MAEFNTIGTPNKLTIICSFWKGLKSFIKVEIEQQDRASTSFKEIVQRAVNAETKAGLRSSIMVWNADSHCPRSYCPSQNTSAKVQIQGLIAKESKPKEFRPKKKKPANDKSSDLPCFNEAIKLNHQEKKKEY